jgi:hypothetical protein
MDLLTLRTSLEHSSKATQPKSQAHSGSKTNTLCARPKLVPPDFSMVETQAKTGAIGFFLGHQRTSEKSKMGANKLEKQ